MIGAAPHLTRLSQGHQFVSAEERKRLEIKPRQMALVREIKMGNGEKDWMFARTLVPNRTLNGSARRISYLNETPIGQILFGRNGAIRQSMQVSLSHELPKIMFDSDVLLPHALWQRQSIFLFPSGPLMVTELFLPDCPIYNNDFV